MKNNLLLKCALFLFMTLSIPSIGQGYQLPSRELVLSLLDRIEDCKDAQNELKKNLENIEANPDDYTLREYNEVKLWIENSQTCLSALRGQLDELRQEYPGWFNDPSTVFDIDRNHSVTPRQLTEILEEIEVKIANALARFEQIPEPEN